jgi:hypothetical protein
VEIYFGALRAQNACANVKLVGAPALFCSQLMANPDTLNFKHLVFSQ